MKLKFLFLFSSIRTLNALKLSLLHKKLCVASSLYAAANLNPANAADNLIVVTRSLPTTASATSASVEPYMPAYVPDLSMIPDTTIAQFDGAANLGGLLWAYVLFLGLFSPFFPDKSVFFGQPR
jgi:hypothetical protein